MAFVLESVQVDGLLFGEGINLRTKVRAATNTAVTLATGFENGDAIDGVTLVTGDRILIKNQASGIENGVYVVQASGAPIRDEDLLPNDNANLFFVWVEEGTDNKATAWVCNNTLGLDIVGANNLTWVRAAGAGTVTLTPGGVGQDNHIVRFDGTTGLIQTSNAIIDDSGNFSGVGDITFDEATNDLTLAVADQTSGVATITIPNLGGINQQVVGTAVAQTLTNKRLDNPSVVNDIAFVETSGTTIMAITDQNNVTATVPNLGGTNQDFVFTQVAQTLSNKRLNNPEVVNDVKFVETSGTTTMTVTDQVNVSANIPNLGGVNQDFVFTQASQTLSNKNLTSPTVTGDIRFDEATNDLFITVTDQGTGTANANIPDLLGVNRDFVFTTLPQTLSNKTFSSILNMGGFKITNVATPTVGTDAVNKDYVDSIASGLDPKESVRVATVGNLAGTYTDANPDTLTGVPNTIDGISLALNNRVLVKNQTDAKQNGIYYVTSVGVTADLARAPDQDGTPAQEVSAGNFTFVELGTVNANSGWVVTGDGILVLNVDNINWTQFSGSATFNAGSGLTKTGNVFSANTSGVTTGIVSNNIVVRSTGTAGQVMRSTGTAGAEGSWGAVDLTNTNAVTGSLTVSNGGTGATSFTAGQILQGNGTGAITSTGISTSTIITTTNTQTLSNKDLIDASTNIIDDVDNTKKFQFQVSGVSTGTTRVLTVPNASTTIVGTDVTQTLTNKTLVAPRFADLDFIADSNGNEMLIFDLNASAVNNFQISNAASTVFPTLSAVGNDTNIGLNIQPKGTGPINFLGTSAQQAQIRLFEDTDNGSNYVAIQTPAALAANYTLTLPVDDGNAGQILQTDGNGVLSWVNTPSARVSYRWLSDKLNVNITSPTIVAYHAWANSNYSDLGTVMRIIFWAERLNNRSLTVTVHNGTSSIGTITVPSGTANGIQSFLCTKPSSDVRLELRVNKSGSGGTSPEIYGLQMEFTNA